MSKRGLNSVVITISFPPWIRLYSQTFYSVSVIITTQPNTHTLRNIKWEKHDEYGNQYKYDIQTNKSKYDMTVLYYTI